MLVLVEHLTPFALFEKSSHPNAPPHLPVMFHSDRLLRRCRLEDSESSAQFLEEPFQGFVHAIGSYFASVRFAFPTSACFRYFFRLNPPITAIAKTKTFINSKTIIGGQFLKRNTKFGKCIIKTVTRTYQVCRK